MNIPAYNNSYLEDSMQALGSMLDYAVNACNQDLEQFCYRFFCSGVARSLFQFSPKYMGLSGIELASLVARRTGDGLQDAPPYIDVGSPEYWAGWALAYVSRALNLDYESLHKRGVTARALLEGYSVLHEADLSKTVDVAREWLMKGAVSVNPLKRQRTLAGLTQKELASLSGVPLRVIRSYEQGQRSLENAGAESILRLSRALSCQIEDLL